MPRNKRPPCDTEKPKTKLTHSQPTPDGDDLLSIRDLCASEHISRRTLDGLRAKRLGPKFFRIGRLLRTTRQERERWRAEMMAKGDG
jgi:hypothetical protein